MYIPPSFKVEDHERLARFVAEHSFATVVTHADGRPFASHLPVLFDSEPAPSGRLLSHMARANPQWRHFSDGQEVLVIFQGPHAYVSPRWYQTELSVPTWNYAVVHVTGTPRIIAEEAAVNELLKRTIKFYEGDDPAAWQGNLPAEFMSKLIKSIVAFEIVITRWEGKFKLSQNREPADIAGAYDGLKQSARDSDRVLAAMMRSEGVV